MRLFIAADLPEDVLGALEDNIQDLSNAVLLSGTRSENNFPVETANRGGKGVKTGVLDARQSFASSDGDATSLPSTQDAVFALTDESFEKQQAFKSNGNKSKHASSDCRVSTDRFTSPDNLHITLAFLGDQPEENVATIEQCMAIVAEEFETVELSLGDYGYFGSGYKKILWQGLEDETELALLANQLRSELDHAGIAFDDKPFRSHITLARNSTVDLDDVEEPWVGEGPVETLTLYRSELSFDGPRYTALRTVRLRAPYRHPSRPIAIIDADACPVTKEAVDEARRAGVPLVLVGNGTQNLAKHLKEGDLIERDRGFWATTINVLGGDDSADFKIATIVRAGDVVVTQDIGVAAMALGADAKAIGVRGREYTKATIDAALLIRHEEKKVRRQGGRTQGPAAFTSEDRARFRHTFRRLLTGE